EMRRIAFSQAYSLLRLAKQAASLGSYDEAERLLNETLRLDPKNGEAEAAKAAVIKARAEGKGKGPRELRLINFQPNPEALPQGEDAPAGSLLGEASKNRKVIIEQATTEVQIGLNEARAMMGRSPDAARSALRQLVD